MNRRILKTVLIITFLFWFIPAKSQHNFLGESQDFIIKHFNKDPEYSVEIDTINKYTTLVTCKTFEQYPYYTYEIDLYKNVCISYAYVSKDREIFDTYVDILDHLGEIIEKDSSMQNFTYKINGKDKTSYYAIKQPFVNSTYYSRRSIFYIMITEELNPDEN
jgi:hypothetical protein